MMRSVSARRECKAGPVYFFDQPTARDRPPSTRILHFSLADAGTRLADTEQSSSKNKLCSTEEVCDENNAHKRGSVGTNNALITSDLNERVPDRAAHPLAAYKDAAPLLLGELGSLLSGFRWSEEGCTPRGLANILSCSAQDLTAGVFRENIRSPVEDCADLTRSLRSHGPIGVKERPKEVIVENTRRPKKKACPKLSSEKKIKACLDLQRRASSPTVHKDRAHACSTISFSMSSKSCKDQGWVLQPAASSQEPPSSALWQWVVQRLQSARMLIELQASRERERGLDQPAVVRHYGAVQPHRNHRSTVDHQRPSALVNGLPRIPQVKPEDPAKRKLHYGTSDGSSVIYYPSGCVAVSQSGSGLPSRGFYTNVFSDGPGPALIASVTASGRGAVTHPVSGAILAVWDRGGGILCGPDGTATKEWSWQRGPKERVLIQVSESISVKLLHGVSGLLRFRSQGETIQLPLSALPHISPPVDTAGLLPHQRLPPHKERTLTDRRSPPVHGAQSRRLSVRTAAPQRQEPLQMVREVEELEEPGMVWGGRGGGGGGGHVEELQRELRRLQRKVRNTLDDWLGFYRSSTGIRCPDAERGPGAPQRARSRREARAVALPSLDPLGWEDPRPHAAPPGRLVAPGDHRLSFAASEAPRSPRKALKEESRVTQTGALRAHSKVRPESVIIPESPARPPPGGGEIRPAVHPSARSWPCPALLRPTLRDGGPAGDGAPPHCCCGPGAGRPLLTDLEYDAFVQNQGARGEQVLVVCVTSPGSHDDALEQLHVRKNRNRAAPCVQCQMDPFRLVRYEMSAGRTGSAKGSLLQIRHNVAPGTLLMYVRGKLRFADHVSTSPGDSVRDLLQQISSTRKDYGLGLSLPADYKIRRCPPDRRPAQQEVKRSPAVPHAPLVKHQECPVNRTSE